MLQAASGGLAHRIREEQLTGTLEALTTQPITVPELSFGLAAFQFGFGMIRAAFYLLLSGLFFGVSFSQTDWVGFVTVLIASGAALASIGVLLGALVLVMKRGEVLTGAITFAMGLVSGAFFPIDVLPGWLQAIGSVVPTRFAYDGLRVGDLRRRRVGRRRGRPHRVRGDRASDRRVVLRPRASPFSAGGNDLPVLMGAFRTIESARPPRVG